MVGGGTVSRLLASGAMFASKILACSISEWNSVFGASCVGDGSDSTGNSWMDVGGNLCQVWKFTSNDTHSCHVEFKSVPWKLAGTITLM